MAAYVLRVGGASEGRSEGGCDGASGCVGGRGVGTENVVARRGEREKTRAPAQATVDLQDIGPIEVKVVGYYPTDCVAEGLPSGP